MKDLKYTFDLVKNPNFNLVKKANFDLANIDLMKFDLVKFDLMKFDLVNKCLFLLSHFSKPKFLIKSCHSIKK